ncbi:MAG: hypothetical protein ISQ34_01305, partial [Rickettsiales bacterium]|nr:hypothetical protein [Rickettsiales bacterium]
MTNNRAFSMVEISMVLVLLTAIIIGILQTTTLMNDAKLSKAQTLTKRSPVKDMQGLIMWLETSLEESFILKEIENGGHISKWIDIKNNVQKPNHATQTNFNNQPTYQEQAFNDAIPGIRFNGSSDYLTFDGDYIVNSPYSIFVVEKRTSNASENYFIGGTTQSSYQNVIMGYQTNTTFLNSNHNSHLTHSVAAYSEHIERIHSFTFDMTNRKSYLNGGSVEASDTVSSPITGFAGASIGRYGSAHKYYQGDLAEIIIFNRALNDKDRNAVE